MNLEAKFTCKAAERVFASISATAHFHNDHLSQLVTSQGWRVCIYLIN